MFRVSRHFLEFAVHGKACMRNIPSDITCCSLSHKEKRATRQQFKHEILVRGWTKLHPLRRIIRMGRFLWRKSALVFAFIHLLFALMLGTTEEVGSDRVCAHFVRTCYTVLAQMIKMHLQ